MYAYYILINIYIYVYCVSILYYIMIYIYYALLACYTIWDTLLHMI